VQFAAAVAADGDQRQIVGEFAGMAHPSGAQGDVDQPRPVAHQFFDGLIGDEAFFQELRAAIQNLAEHDGENWPPSSASDAAVR
jgi:hypothetical protein